MIRTDGRPTIASPEPRSSAREIKRMILVERLRRVANGGNDLVATLLREAADELAAA